MNIDLEGRYQARTSFVHRRDPRVKLVAVLTLLLTISLLPFGAYWLYVTVWVCILGASLAARLGPGYLVKRSFVALPFALAALALPFTVSGVTIATLPGLGWGITQEGIVRASSIIIKSWVSVQAAILLVAVTTLPDLLWALGRMRVPAALIAIVSFMYRYLFVLVDEASRLLRARSSRSAALPGRRSGGSLWWRGRVAGYMVGSLMMRSFERSERIYQAMTARGYRGQLRTLDQHRLAVADWLALAATLILSAGLIWTGHIG